MTTNAAMSRIQIEVKKEIIFQSETATEINLKT